MNPVRRKSPVFLEVFIIFMTLHLLLLYDVDWRGKKTPEGRISPIRAELPPIGKLDSSDRQSSFHNHP
jgi:hypothetical protein